MSVSSVVDNPSSPASPSLRGSIRGLFNALAEFRSENHLNRDMSESNIKEDFRAFLVRCDYRLALKNFDALLTEKSGSKARRSDGTVNWYHELVPILMMLNLAFLGKKRGGFDLKEMDRWGGLEVAICTHLRHDSAEDFISKEKLQEQLSEMCEQLTREDPSFDARKCKQQIDQIMCNIDLMTQKRLFEAGNRPVLRSDGKQEKESVLDYSARMVDPRISNPVVFMLKQCDLIHNAATIYGAGKFTPAKVLERCNRMEDMYGPRYGFTGRAIKNWPEFSKAISTLDHIMGVVLYPHFRYLENVELYYKQPSDYEVGIDRYMNKAMKLTLPQALHPVHISLARMMSSVNPDTDPEKYARLQRHMERVIKPSIEKWKGYFPYLFPAGNDNNPAPSSPRIDSSVA